MKKITFFIFASLLAGTISAAVPDGYYDSLTGLNGAALRKAAKNVVRKHTVINYGTDTWNAFKKTDVHFVNGQNCWWDMYSNNNVNVSSGHDGLNIEHSVANSWWGKTKNDAYKDLFHLNPSNSDANSRKGNFPLGEVGSQTWSNGPTTIGKPVSGQGGGNGSVYEPCDEYKGDFARVFMYMFTVYDDISWKSNTAWMYDTNSADLFKPWAVDLLLKWHRQDPVSEKEIARNEAIYGIQHNRNPYIDSPELAEYVWGNLKGQPYKYGGEYTPVVPNPDDPSDPEPIDPNPGYEEPVEPAPGDGVWNLVASMADINADDQYVAVGGGDKSNVIMTYNLKTTKSSGYFEVADVDVLGGSEKYIMQLPEDAAIIRFVPSGADYKAGISSKTGESKGWLECSAVKTMGLASSSSGATAFDLSVSAGTAVFDFASYGKLFFNESSPRFTTYTSTGQKSLQLYRFKRDTATSNITIEDDSDSVFIYTIQGIRVNTTDVNSLPAGPYIEVRPGKTPRKILVGVK